MMITRQIARRHGRALAGSRLVRLQIQRRNYAQETDRVEQSLEDSLRESHSIGSALQNSSPKVVPQLDGRTFQQLDPATSKIAEKYSILKQQNDTTGRFGATVKRNYKPNDVLRNPPPLSAISPELLLASQAHMGHSTSLWNPMNSKYIHGVREGIHIISLEETAAHLRLACNVVSGVAERGGLILFAGTRKGQARSVVLAAKLSKGYHLFNRWTPGSITNKEQILGPYQLKMVDQFDKDIAVNPEILSKQPAVMPDLVVCLNPLENWVLLHECALNNIPTIAIIDTDADPTWVTYPIPANDDSLRCTNLIAGFLGRAGEEGQRIRVERTAQGDVPYDPHELPDLNENDDVYKMRLDADKNHQYQVEYVDKDDNPISHEKFQEIERQGVVLDDSMMTVYLDGDTGDARDEKPYYFDDETGEPVQEYEPIFEGARTQAQQTRKAPVSQIPDEGADVSARPSEAGQAKSPAVKGKDVSGAEAVAAAQDEKTAQRDDNEAVEADNRASDDGRRPKSDDEKKDGTH